MPELKLRRLPGMGRRRALPPLPHGERKPEELAVLVSQEQESLAERLGDENLAKRVLKRKKTMPKATVPELIFMDFLDRRRIKYSYQQYLLGGRVLKGGQVVDFIIEDAGRVIIVEVQGLYWHSKPEKQRIDVAQRMALLALTIFGRRVSSVVELWDTRLVTNDRAKRRQAMENALLGVELGP